MSSTNNPWFAATIGLLGLIAGYVIANGANGLSLNPSAGTVPAPTDNAIPTPPPTNDTPATADDDAVLGSEDATVTLIEFTDYQCPFCGRHYEQTFGEIKKNYVDTGKVKYIVRDFPLGFHPFAQKAAEATECADDQGMFWEMHSLLFKNQATWSQAADGVATFKQYASDLGLNTATFNACLDGATHEQEVKDDMAAGSASGIDGTPGFWILGPDDQSQKISGAYPYDTFKTAFDEMLK